MRRAALRRYLTLQLSALTLGFSGSQFFKNEHVTDPVTIACLIAIVTSACTITWIVSRPDWGIR